MFGQIHGGTNTWSNSLRDFVIMTICFFLSAEIWGQWLHLAAGLHPPRDVPIPASEVDLVARYGPEVRSKYHETKEFKIQKH